MPRTEIPEFKTDSLIVEKHEQKRLQVDEIYEAFDKGSSRFVNIKCVVAGIKEGKGAIESIKK